MKQAAYYTDGSCGGNPGVGRWAYVEAIPCDRGIKTNIVTGNKQLTTNNEMELTAVYMALVKSLKTNRYEVTIYSDSSYVVNAITKGWLSRWRVNGWKTKDGKEVKNKHIWEKMYKLVYEKNLQVTFIQVKGHRGDLLNELADKSAVEARVKLEEELKSKS